jgi:hypothetical protein
VWKRKKRANGTYTKPPYRPDNPKQLADPGDPRTWSTFAIARAAVERGDADGLGICLLNTGLVGFDLDNCIDVKGQVEPVALQFIELASSYVERSPSGTGFHIFGTGAGGELNRKQRVPDANGMSIETARATAKYFTLTGDVFPGSSERFNDLSALADDTVAELDKGGPQKPRGKRKLDLDDIIRNGEGSKFGGDRSRAVWWVVNELIRRGQTDDEIVSILLNQSNRISDHVYDQKQDAEKYARRQIEKARGAAPDPLISGGLEDDIALQFSAKYVEDLRYVALWGKLVAMGRHPLGL